jgi:phosphoglycolate phosphatase
LKKGIIFDMDGTLWDSSRQVCEAWDLAVAKCGYQRAPITTEEMQSVMGKTMDVIAEILFPFAQGQKRQELLAVCCEEENKYLRENGGVLYPDIRVTMERLKSDYHLYIVSNCQAGYIEAFLDFYRMWDLIEDIECYGNNGKQKGENIALLCARNLRTPYILATSRGITRQANRRGSNSSTPRMALAPFRIRFRRSVLFPNCRRQWQTSYDFMHGIP